MNHSRPSLLNELIPTYSQLQVTMASARTAWLAVQTQRLLPDLIDRITTPTLSSLEPHSALRASPPRKT